MEADDYSDDDYTSRRAILEPAIRSVVDALGGYEDGRYRLGDECYGCLKDLKKFWRKDDTDDERTVARIFWATRVLPNDLVPILLETAGKGMFEDKRAIAVADLMTAMTWPIDMAEELKEAMRVRPWYEKDVTEARQQQRRGRNEFAVIGLKGSKEEKARRKNAKREGFKL